MNNATKPISPWKCHVPFILVCTMVIGIYCWSAETGPFEIHSPRAADSYYNLLVQGFSAGQLNVKRDPPPGLADLPNPFDPVANRSYVWSIDHYSYEMSYYRGKLYLYFGVTPAIVLFWPYAALTGHYCAHKDAVVIFDAICFLAAAWLIYAVRRRYFADTSVWIVIFGVFALGLAPCFMDQLACADLREVPRSCAFAFTMLTLAAIWNALHQPRRQIQILWLALASLAYGLAVGARPSLLPGIIILLIPVFKNLGSPTESGIVTRRIWLLLAAVVPALVVGLDLAAYNDLRFDNPFEFGWRYQLTDIQNSLAQPFSSRYLWFNFKLYFLQPFSWTSSYPFIQTQAPSSPPSQYYGTGNAYCGILLNCPLVWLAPAVILVWREPQLAPAAALRSFLSAVLLVFAICVVALCCFFAGSSSYLTDFMPALIMLAVVGACALERTFQGRPVFRHWFRFGGALLLAYSIIVGVLVGIKSHAYANYILGNSSSNAGQNSEALADYRKAVMLDPVPALFHIALGNACLKSGRLDEAIAEYRKAIARDPANTAAMYNLSLGLLLSGNIDEAAGLLQKVVELNPDFLSSQPPEAQIDLAWSLAVNPDPAKRNGKIAVLLAESACRQTGYKNTRMVGTLAAAYAESGRFDDATNAAQQTCALAETNGQTNLLRRTRELLQLYQNHQPYHEAPPPVRQ